MLESHRVLSLDRSAALLNNQAILGTGYVSNSTLDLRGYTTLMLYIKAAGAGTLKLSLRANATDDSLKIVPALDSLGIMSNYIDTVDKWYIVDVSLFGSGTLYAEAENTSTSVSINYVLTPGIPFLSTIERFIENRKKVEQVLAKVVSVNGGGELVELPELRGIDMSKYAYYLLRVRSRQTGNANYYGVRSFRVNEFWTYNLDPDFTTPANGDTPGSDAYSIIDTSGVPAYDVSTGWIEVKGTTLGFTIRNYEAEALEFEFDVIGIR
jgi:hypothetical protein